MSLPVSEGLASRCRYTKGDANQPVNAGNTDTVHYTVRVFDGLREFSRVVANNFTPIRAGYYLISATAIIDLQVNNGYSIRIVVNGVGLCSSVAESNGAMAGDTPTSVNHVLYLTPNDNLRIDITNLGLAQLTIRQNVLTTFSAHRLS